MGKGVEKEEKLEKPVVVGGSRKVVKNPNGREMYVVDISNLSDGSTRRDVHTEGKGDPEWAPPGGEMTE